MYEPCERSFVETAAGGETRYKPESSLGYPRRAQGVRASARIDGRGAPARSRDSAVDCAARSAPGPPAGKPAGLGDARPGARSRPIFICVFYPGPRFAEPGRGRPHARPVAPPRTTDRSGALRPRLDQLRGAVGFGRVRRGRRRALGRGRACHLSARKTSYETAEVVYMNPPGVSW